MARGWTGDNEYREIVQIGALKIDWPSGEVLGELNLLVKPVRNPLLSDYFTQLTHITQEQVDTHGIGFPAALQLFLDFVGKDPACSFGNDSAIIAENIALSHCDPLRFYYTLFTDLRNFFDRVAPETKKLNSGKLGAHFGADLSGHEHDALFDCHSILAGLKALHARGDKFHV